MKNTISTVHFSLLKKLFHFINPLVRLGERKYSYFLPLFVTITIATLSEFFIISVFNNPELRGLIAIFMFISIILYFSLRDGLKGGFTSATVTILYYLYIVYDQGETRESIQTIALFGLIYFAIAGIIGWLRQSIDRLIEKETDDRRRLNVVIEQLPVGVIINDKDGSVEFANKQAENILGVKIPIGYQIYQKPLVKTTYLGKPVASSKTIFAQHLKSTKPIIGREYEVYRPDGKKVYIQSNSSAILNRKGEVIATASIFNNITEQKEAELRKDDFVNMASHELKTPLTSMQLYVDTLASSIKKSNNSKTSKLVTGIKLQINRLQKLVAELLDVSRLQTGRLTYSKEKFILDDLILDAIETLEATKKQKRIEFTSHYKGNLIADKFRVTQVLNNLLTNAIKYSPENTKVIVKTKRTDGFALVSVKDFGIGIDKTQHKKIFDRLYQVTDKYEKTFPGLGMGLYISKEIIKTHRGKIWVESKKGKGSIFYFSLPIAKE